MFPLQENPAESLAAKERPRAPPSPRSRVPQTVP